MVNLKRIRETVLSWREVVRSFRRWVLLLPIILTMMLARAPDEDEIKRSAGLSDAGDFRALIQNLLDGAEYNSKFGECGVPGERMITDKRCFELQR